MPIESETPPNETPTLPVASSPTSAPETKQEAEETEIPERKFIEDSASKTKKGTKGLAAAHSAEKNGLEKPKIIKAKGRKNVLQGIVHILASFNNTIISITDQNGQVLGWSSAGKCSFKGSRKSTAYAAQLVAQDACRQAMSHGLKEVEVRVKGPGSGRESAVRAIQAIGLEINLIQDVTPIPHNGCRPPKQRRV